MFFIKTGRAQRHHFLGASWRGRPHAACLCSDSAQTPGENLNSLFCTWIPNAGSLHSSPRRHPLGLGFPEQLSSVPRQVILGMILQFDLAFIETCAGFFSVRLPGKQRIPVFKAFCLFHLRLRQQHPHSLLQPGLGKEGGGHYGATAVHLSPLTSRKNKDFH